MNINNLADDEKNECFLNDCLECRVFENYEDPLRAFVLFLWIDVRSKEILEEMVFAET